MTGFFRRVGKLAAELAFSLVVTAFLPIGVYKVNAAAPKVEQTEAVDGLKDYSSITDIQKTEAVGYNSDDEGNFAEYFNKKKKITGDSGSITVVSSYPRFCVYEGDSEELVKALHKALKKAFYSDIVSEAKTIIESDSFKSLGGADLVIESSYYSRGRIGNILSVTECIEIRQEDGTVIQGSFKTLNFDFNSRKSITSLKSIFKDVNKMKSDIVRELKAQVEEWRQASPEYTFNDNIDWKAVKKSINMDSISFLDSCGIYTATANSIIISDDFIPQFAIPMDILLKYIKPEKMQLLIPLSSDILYFDVDYYSGYYWIYDEPEEDDCVQLIHSLFLFNTALPDDQVTQNFFFRAIAPGEETLKFQLIDPSENVVEERSVKVVVYDNLFFYTVIDEE